ncbi:MAG: hypothetical protein ABJF23_02425 [Bryobacteraceae bacterium]
MPKATPSQNLSAWIVVSMLVMIAVPVGITLHSLHTPAIMTVPDPNPTPYGYTWSLSLFVIPIIVIAWWFFPGAGVEVPKRSFWRTIWILVPLGFGLDFFCANRFFTFANSGATLRIGAPALGGNVPIEEYAFYLSGFIVILLLYIWLDEYWLSAYNVPGYAAEWQQGQRLLRFHFSSLVVGAAILGAAVIYKRFRSPYLQGFPEYFAVLVMGGLVPSMGFFRAACRFINWRAFSLTIFMILLISMFWEATMAVPCGWWGYRQERMMGLFIGAWAGLPIEVVTVWIAVTYGTTIVYEVVKIWQHSGSTAKQAFLGIRPQA